jgi:hypothetical protein
MGEALASAKYAYKSIYLNFIKNCVLYIRKILFSLLLPPREPKLALYGITSHVDVALK